MKCSNIFNDSFAAAFRKQPQNTILVRLLCTHDIQIPKLTVNPDGIMSLINNLTICTLAGDDEVSSKLVKITENVNSVILSSLFFLSLILFLRLLIEKFSKDVPVHKTGNKPTFNIEKTIL